MHSTTVETISPQILIPLGLDQENLSAFWGSTGKETSIVECCLRLAPSGY